MPSLKELQTRINSVKSTRKITSAMKMVAASRLKKAQDAVNNAKDYNQRLEQMFSVVLGAVDEQIKNSKTVEIPRIISGNAPETIVDGEVVPRKVRHLVIIHSSDRGLCGGFNAVVTKFARGYLRDLIQADKEVKIICLGKKARDILKSEFSDLYIEYVEEEKHLSRKADALGIKLLNMFTNEEIDEVSVVYNKFISAMSHEPRSDMVLPVVKEEIEVQEDVTDSYFYNFEPTLEDVLSKMAFSIMRNRLYRAEVESMASEQGARMTSMDSSTRNAGDIIDRLTLTYNRRRQAAITTELVEIIAGAEAV